MKLEGYRSHLSGDQANAIFRAQQALEAFSHWRLPTRFLDVGCGSGELLRMLRAHGVPVLAGVDGVQDALNRCQDFQGSVYRVDLNTSGLPFADRYFDGVACLEVLEHLYAPQNTLMEIVRVTQPTGRILLSVPNPFSYSTRLRILFGGTVSDPLTLGGHIKFFRAGDIRSMCRSCGLEIVRLRGVASPTAYKKYGSLTSWLAKWLPALFVTWFFAFCEKPAEAQGISY